MKIKAIITGVTGMVGEGVLLECVAHPDIEKILLINRKPSGFTDPKISEIVHGNFHDLSAIENQLIGYDACFFCLGVSSVGMTENDYRSLTYDLTMSVAQTLAKQNSAMTFCYISGAGTDSSEKGRSMWARIKGKTENDLMRLPFQKTYAFRPGYLHPTAGMKNTHPYYAYIKFLFPIIRAMTTKYASTLSELGLAMINAATKGYEKSILEVPDIIELAKR